MVVPPRFPRRVPGAARRARGVAVGRTRYTGPAMAVTTRVGSLTVVATPLGNAHDLSPRGGLGGGRGQGLSSRPLPLPRFPAAEVRPAPPPLRVLARAPRDARVLRIADAHGGDAGQSRGDAGTGPSRLRRARAHEGARGV